MDPGVEVFATNPEHTPLTEERKTKAPLLLSASFSAEGKPLEKAASRWLPRGAGEQ